MAKLPSLTWTMPLLVGAGSMVCLSFADAYKAGGIQDWPGPPPIQSLATVGSTNSISRMIISQDTIQGQDIIAFVGEQPPYFQR